MEGFRYYTDSFYTLNLLEKAVFCPERFSQERHNSKMSIFSANAISRFKFHKTLSLTNCRHIISISRWKTHWRLMIHLKTKFENFLIAYLKNETV